MQYEAPTQKFGYLDIKQSSKVKGRKLKSWRRRWIVLTKMSDLSSDQIVARIDIYDNEAKWRSGSGDRTTFVLENVTSIGMANSRTHVHAFEIVERQPVLVMSGSSELDSYSWILAFQQIFTPEIFSQQKDTFQVTVLANEHSLKWQLTGQHSLTVGPACVSLLDRQANTCVSWGLSTLIKFNVDKHSVTQEKTVLVIQCGPNSPTGQSTFQFESSEAMDILSRIRQSICFALANKQNQRRATSRQRSISATISEKSFQNLLDSTPIHPLDLSRDRSDSDSSTSTANAPTSPSMYGTGDGTTANGVPGSWAAGVNGSPHRPPRMSDIGRTNSGRSNSELGAVDEVEEPVLCDDIDNPGEKVVETIENSEQVAKSIPKDDPGYSVIKDSTKCRDVPRRNTFTSASVNNRDSTSNSSLDDTMSDSFRKQKAVSFDSASKTETHHYNEPDLFRDQHFGRLNRRRSSSTGDINAFLKQREHEATFENVYEELDEMRSSVAKLINPYIVSETPPELPARPFSASFSSSGTTENRNENKKKRSFFKRKNTGRDRSATTSAEVLERIRRPCSCDEIRAERLKAICIDGRCVACGGFLPDTRDKREDMVNSNSSSANDIYSSISDITSTGKHRRSSDITPVSSTALARERALEPNGAVKFKTIPSQWNKETVKHLFQTSSSSKPSPQERLIDLSSDGSDSMPKAPQQPDPLISFFLDDNSFSCNPMVTGKLIPSHPPAPSSFDLLSLENIHCGQQTHSNGWSAPLSSTGSIGALCTDTTSPVSRDGVAAPVTTMLSPVNMQPSFFAMGSNLSPPLTSTAYPPVHPVSPPPPFSPSTNSHFTPQPEEPNSFSLFPFYPGFPTVSSMPSVFSSSSHPNGFSVNSPGYPDVYMSMASNGTRIAQRSDQDISLPSGLDDLYVSPSKRSTAS